jgi:hypothetical protein
MDKLKEEKMEKEIAVVAELPSVQTSSYTSPEGKEYELIPLTEAVTEILKTTRELKQALIGKK